MGEQKISAGDLVNLAFVPQINIWNGNRSIQVVKENPYRLATDIFGIGFVTADHIAERLGFDKNSRLRAEAGILYVLHQLADEGNVYFPYEPLLDKCQEILGVEREIIVRAVAATEVDRRVVIEELNGGDHKLKKDNRGVYLTKFHVTETGIAGQIKALLKAPKSIRSFDSNKAASWVQERLSIDLAENQVQALRSAAENKVLVITGGPGTGKTTIINALLKIFSGLKVRIMLAAPTGRAAKRISETTGYEAKTIHRLLE
jgi:exodeoxyribonuclease V alpha subunit